MIQTPFSGYYNISISKMCIRDRDYIIEGFEEKVRQILIMMMAEACREFEKLPIIKYADILRNILYSGVWCRFETVSEKRKEKQEKKHV